MSVGIGSKSRVSYAEESSFGVHPNGVGENIIFKSSNIAKQINTIVSESIRPDRAVPSVRGGNVAAGGDITAEFSPNTFGKFLKHFSAGAVGSANVTDTSGITAAPSSQETGLARHTVRKVAGSPDQMWVCFETGATGNTGADLASDLGAAAGTLMERVVSGDTTWVLFAFAIVAAADSTAYSRGDYILSGNNTYLCTKEGTSASNISSVALAHTTGEVQNGTAFFEFYGVTASKALYKHVVIPGTTLETGGLSVEHIVDIGTATPTHFQFVGGRVNTLGITVPQEGIVDLSMGLLFQDLVSADSTSGFTGSSTTSDEPITGFQAALAIFPITGGGGINTSMSDLNLNFTNNFDENVYVIGKRFRHDLPVGRREVTGSMTAFFESLTEFNFFANETEVRLEVTMNVLGQLVKLIFPENKFTGGSPTPEISGPGTVTSSFEFQTFKQDSDDDYIIELFNSTASY